MKKLILLFPSVFLLGCQATAPVMKNSVSFQINDQYENKKVVYKNNWPQCGNRVMENDVKKNLKYITHTSNCYVEPEGYVPNQIIIDYVPWLTIDQMEQKFGPYPQKQGSNIALGYPSEQDIKEYKAWYDKQQQLISQIPASAWKRIVLTPPKDVEKYKFQLPEGKGVLLRGKTIHYLISLKQDGSYTIKTDLRWTAPYQMHWN